MRWITLALLTLIVATQASLWFGKGSLPYSWTLQKTLDTQQTRNASARERNARVAAEVSDLKEGLEMVEDKARSELGMVRPNEILVQVHKRP